MDLLGIILYYILIANMALVEAILFAISTLGFIATGVGSLVGPLLVAFLLFPSMASKFWKWVDFMFVYAFYRVIASAFVFVWIHAMVGFFQNTLHGDCSMAHFLALLVPWLLLQFAFIWSMFQAPHLAHELFGGASGFGTSLGSAVRGAPFVCLAHRGDLWIAFPSHRHRLTWQTCRSFPTWNITTESSARTGFSVGLWP